MCVSEKKCICDFSPVFQRKNITEIVWKHIAEWPNISNNNNLSTIISIFTVTEKQNIVFVQINVIKMDFILKFRHMYLIHVWKVCTLQSIYAVLMCEQRIWQWICFRKSQRKHSNNISIWLFIYFSKIHLFFKIHKYLERKCRVLHLMLISYHLLHNFIHKTTLPLNLNKHKHFTYFNRSLVKLNRRSY